MAAKDDARFQHIAKMVAAQLSTPELPDHAPSYSMHQVSLVSVFSKKL